MRLAFALVVITGCSDEAYELGGVCQGQIPVGQVVEATVIKAYGSKPVPLLAAEVVDKDGYSSISMGAALHPGTATIEIYASTSDESGFLAVKPVETGDWTQFEMTVVPTVTVPSVSCRTFNR